MNDSPVAERILRECDCEPQVVACAHLDDESVLTIHKSWTFPRDNEFFVCLIRRYEGGIDGEHGPILPERRGDQAGITYEAALEAFHAAEIELLRGEA